MYTQWLALAVWRFALVLDRKFQASHYRNVLPAQSALDSCVSVVWMKRKPSAICLIWLVHNK